MGMSEEKPVRSNDHLTEKIIDVAKERILDALGLTEELLKGLADIHPSLPYVTVGGAVGAKFGRVPGAFIGGVGGASVYEIKRSYFDPVEYRGPSKRAVEEYWYKSGRGRYMSYDEYASGAKSAIPGMRYVFFPEDGEAAESFRLPEIHVVANPDDADGEWLKMSVSDVAKNFRTPALDGDEASIMPKAYERYFKAIELLEDESDNIGDSVDKLNDSVGKKLNPKVKDLANNVEQFDEVASKDLQAGRKYMFGQFGLDEKGMPLGGLPKREDLLVGGQELSVTEPEKEDIGDIQKGIKKQVSVLNHVADGLDVVGYDLKGVGSFSTAIEQLTLASKLGDTAGFDSTKAYVAGFSSLFQGVGANIGGGVGSALSSMGSMAASGASIGSAIAPGGIGAVVGAVVGGAVGLISSIFGGDDEDEQEEAARERMRQQIYQGMLSRSLSGAGPHSLKMLRESGWD